MAALVIGALAAPSLAAAQALDAPLIETVSIGFRVLFAVLVAVVVPVYLVKYGPANFLWFSDIGLLGICAALWLEQRLLGSMMALAVLLPETLWLVSFVTGAFARERGVTTLAAYMFDARIPFFLRALSGAFHLALPPGALWLVYLYGYDDRALIAQTMLAWLVLPATLWLAPPEKNVNWVRGIGHPPRRRIPLPLHFGLVMLAYPLLIHLPTHLLLARYFDR
ncbi:MAG TPA: membrane-associated protein [Gammaproteobacteria bacterium]|nr:membrane-associated protein [Gammaproteobacteria bacterium]